MSFMYKCKMCGGDLEIGEQDSTAVCAFCGVRQTLPKLDNDRRSALYDRANHFRRNNDYSKAAAIFEQILSEDPSDAEAYWSLVLCRYGVEYVEDALTRKRVITVNRTQYVSVYDDENYRAALEHADSEQKALYEEEAQTINEIQKNILAISNEEEPFDVFICYKETDDRGRRTPDSVLANDIYHQLVQEGYRVFFSRITLEDKLGTAYEPYIFAALNSAKIMVVLGTRPEYFNAVWVKNEWSRYLGLIKGGAKKLLIPAYRDMDPYDLPDEFSHLQAQDMSRLGFMQDLIRGINKILNTAAPQAPAPAAATPAPQAEASADTQARLFENATTYIRLGDYQTARGYYETAVREYAANPEGWWGLIVCETESFRKVMFDTSKLTTWFKNAQKLSDEASFVQKKTDYLNYLKEIASTAANEDVRQKTAALQRYREGIVTTESELTQLQAEFSKAEKEYLDNVRIAEREMARLRGSISRATKDKQKNELLNRLMIIIPIGLFIFMIKFGLAEAFFLFLTLGLASVFVCRQLASNHRPADINALTTQLENTRASVPSNDFTQTEAYRDFQRELEEKRTHLATLQQKADIYQQYLSFGQEKVVELDFSRRCAAIGITEDVDAELSHCYDLIKTLKD